MTIYRKMCQKNVGMPGSGKISTLEIPQRIKSPSSVSQTKGNVKNCYDDIFKNTIA